jgi:hypothetical protein
MVKDKYFTSQLFPGHTFQIRKVFNDPFGTMIKISCSGHCCTFPNFIEMTLPLKEAYRLFVKK